MSQKAHAELSASGSERWHNCSGSVALSRGLPDESSEAADEGTRAHAVAERFLKYFIKIGKVKKNSKIYGDDRAMTDHAFQFAKFVFDIHKRHRGSDIFSETRSELFFIDKNMWGTFDGVVAEHFGVLYIFDFKYGKHTVSARKNLQMIFYALGIAHKYNWNFKRVRLYIYQPRIRSWSGEPTYWELSIEELESYVKIFKKAVARVKSHPKDYKEGDWCYFCRARNICPLKKQKQQNMVGGFLDAHTA